MTGYEFRATWPLLPGTDTSTAGFARLKTEACAEIDALARGQGARIVGDIEWRLEATRLVAVAPAVRIGVAA